MRTPSAVGGSGIGITSTRAWVLGERHAMNKPTSFIKRISSASSLAAAAVAVIEMMESRPLLSGTFVISGSGSMEGFVDTLPNDNIPPRAIAVMLNGNLQGTPPLGTVIEVHGSVGDDMVTTATSGGADFVLFGERGNDTLIAGSPGLGDQNVTMYGGTGNDRFQN